MNDWEIQNIWNNANSNAENVRFSLNEIKQFRKSYSNKTTILAHRLIVYDTGYKILIIAAYFCLLFLTGISWLNVGLSAALIGLLLFLVSKNYSLNSQLKRIDESGDVFGVLKLKYDFLSRFYREYIVTQSITHPLFVLAGFQFYQFFKYSEGRLKMLLTDPVTYIFLVLAFIIPFYAQRLTYAKELHDFEEILDIGFNEESDEIKIMRLKRKKKARLIIYIIVILIGLSGLLVILDTLV